MSQPNPPRTEPMPLPSNESMRVMDREAAKFIAETLRAAVRPEDDELSDWFRPGYLIEVANTIEKLAAQIPVSQPLASEGIPETPSDGDAFTQAIEESLQSCIVEDDVAAIAIYLDAIANAGVALRTASDVLHTIRSAISRDLARKPNQYLAQICTLIDGVWEDSVVFGRLHADHIAPISEARK